MYYLNSGLFQLEIFIVNDKKYLHKYMFHKIKRFYLGYTVSGGQRNSTKFKINNICKIFHERI